MHRPSLTEKGFTAGKKIPGNFISKKNPENIFPGVRKIYGKYF